MSVTHALTRREVRLAREADLARIARAPRPEVPPVLAHDPVDQTPMVWAPGGQVACENLD